MGEPKLLLKIGQLTLIERLIRQLQECEFKSICVLVREDDLELQREVDRCGATVVSPSQAPQEMRESVEILLKYLTLQNRLQDDDGWLLIPADYPVVLPSVLESLIESWRESPTAISVPLSNGRRGHPTIFPAAVAQRVQRIPPNKGLNWLLRQSSLTVNEVEVDAESIHWDVDTPSDLQRIRRIMEE
jgi:molybdenum cofactor cytidylyltransferase